jgi:hypothetical protein
MDLARISQLGLGRASVAPAGCWLSSGLDGIRCNVRFGGKVGAHTNAKDLLDLGDDNAHTVPGYGYDCFAVPPAEVEAIARGTPLTHINCAHNMPLDVIPAIDHNRSKSALAPAFFAAKTCDRTSPGACQNSTKYSFNWLVDTFTWKGITGIYNIGGEQVVKTEVGST